MHHYEIHIVLGSGSNGNAFLKIAVVAGMKLKIWPICIAIIVSSSTFALAQDRFSIPACGPFSKSQRYVGGRLKLPLPKGGIVKGGGDVDYSDYHVGFGKKKNRVWLSGIFGPMATSGQVSKDWISSSNDVSQRTWSFGEIEGVDAKGKLANGNYWRYVGQYGESISYYDVHSEAAAYFDKILDGLCYQEWKR